MLNPRAVSANQTCYCAVPRDSALHLAAGLTQLRNCKGERVNSVLNLNDVVTAIMVRQDAMSGKTCASLIVTEWMMAVHLHKILTPHRMGVTA
jgi:hypothetical protein